MISRLEPNGFWWAGTGLRENVVLRHVAPPFVVNAMYAGTLSTLGYELQVVAGSTTVTKLV